jgi:hypothetical protein
LTNCFGTWTPLPRIPNPNAVSDTGLLPQVRACAVRSCVHCAFDVGRRVVGCSSAGTRQFPSSRRPSHETCVGWRPVRDDGWSCAGHGRNGRGLGCRVLVCAVVRRRGRHPAPRTPAVLLGRAVRADEAITVISVVQGAAELPGAVVVSDDRRACPQVVGFAAQPFRLLWPGERGERRHMPDFFARRKDGTGVVVEVRPDHLVDPKTATVFEATATACREAGWRFHRTGGPPAVLAANMRWLSGYRHPRCHRPEITDALLERFAEPMPLLRGAEMVGDRLAVLPVLYHLLQLDERFRGRQLLSRPPAPQARIKRAARASCPADAAGQPSRTQANVTLGRAGCRSRRRGRLV